MRSGFSLIELVVVILIVGIFAVVAVPAYVTREFPDTAVVGANRISDIIRAASRRASIEKREVRLVIDLGGRRYAIEALDASGPAMTTMDTFTLPPGVKALPADTARVFLFWPSGAASGDPITVQNDSTNLLLLVSAIGEPNVRR